MFFFYNLQSDFKHEKLWTKNCNTNFVDDKINKVCSKTYFQRAITSEQSLPGRDFDRYTTEALKTKIWWKLWKPS